MSELVYQIWFRSWGSMWEYDSDKGLPYYEKKVGEPYTDKNIALEELNKLSRYMHPGSGETYLVKPTKVSDITSETSRNGWAKEKMW